MAICGHLFLMTRRKSLFGSNQDYMYSGDKEDCRENGHWWTSNRLFAETQSNRKNPRISLSGFPPNLSRYRRRIVRCRSLVLKYAIISQSTLMTYRLHLSLSLSCSLPFMNKRCLLLLRGSACKWHFLGRDNGDPLFVLLFFSTFICSVRARGRGVLIKECSQRQRTLWWIIAKFFEGFFLFPRRLITGL